MKRYIARTVNGSEYVVEGNGTAFKYLGFSHQATVDPDRNVKIDSDYELENVMPWPPEVGKSLLMVTKHLHDKSHPDRMPGGGKITSPIVEVTEVKFE